MSKGKNDKLIFPGGSLFYTDKRGKRIEVQSFEEAQQLASKCCGIDCCNGTINGLKDSTTGVIYNLSIDNGEIVLNDQSTGVQVGPEVETAKYLITQVGVGDGVATVFENNILDSDGTVIGSLTIEENATGDFSINYALDDPGFTTTNTFITLTPSGNQARTYEATVTGSNEINLLIYDLAGLAANTFDVFLTIDHYPNLA